MGSGFSLDAAVSRKVEQCSMARACHRGYFWLWRFPVVKGYSFGNQFFDEMVAGETGVRPHYMKFQQLFDSVPTPDFEQKRLAVDLAFLRQGITFNVYGDAQGTERIFPFDLVPRIIPGKEWEHI